MKKIIISIILIAVITCGGLYAYKSGLIFKAAAKVTTTEKTCDATNGGRVITYKGVKGKTAMALLQKNCETTTSGSGDMIYVTGINGVTASTAKSEFWSFKINNVDSTVGAAMYQTADSDIITWTLTTF